ncbi:MAG: hypothetical protein QOK42_1035 [Frankiaceae bacterium]|nr:hypothetical protein [Frankiaceae bacterium]
MSVADPSRELASTAAQIPAPHAAPQSDPHAAPNSAGPVAACVEVGASGAQTAVLDHFGRLSFYDGVAVPGDVPVLAAVPGLLSGTHVVAASNLGWFDVPVAEALGLDEPVHLLCNDAEAAALGEQVLRGGEPDLVYVGVGTGVGGAVVRGGAVTGNLFGHSGSFGARRCPCGSTGCLETVAAGWALGDPASTSELERAAQAIAAAVEAEPLATPQLVVLAGGIPRRHPNLLAMVAAALPGRRVEPTIAPPAAKSAAAWGLLHLRTP